MSLNAQEPATLTNDTRSAKYAERGFLLCVCYDPFIIRDGRTAAPRGSIDEYGELDLRRHAMYCLWMAAELSGLDDDRNLHAEVCVNRAEVRVGAGLVKRE